MENVPVVAPGSSHLVSDPVGGMSSTSVGSRHKPRKSMTEESQGAATDLSTSSHMHSSSAESTPSKDRTTLREKDKDKDESAERKGPIGWFKAKVAHAKEEREERKAEKERAKSPPRNGADHATSKQSLTAIANEGYGGRGRSEMRSEGTIQEQQQEQKQEQQPEQQPEPVPPGSGEKA